MSVIKESPLVDKMLRNSKAGKQWLEGELSENSESDDDNSESDEDNSENEEAEQEQEREAGEISSIESIEEDDPESGEAELEISRT